MRLTKLPGMVKPQLTAMSARDTIVDRNGRLTNIVDVLAVCRGIRSINTCSQAEVIWAVSYKGFCLIEETDWKT